MTLTPYFAFSVIKDEYFQGKAFLKNSSDILWGEVSDSQKQRWYN